MNKEKISYTDLAIECLSKLKPTYYLGENEEPCLSLEYKGKFKAYKVQSKNFKSLLHTFFRENNLKFKSHQFVEIIDEIESLCLISSMKNKTFTRIGYDENNNIVIDLADEDNNYVVISSDGFKIAKNVKTPFISLNDQCKLPIPKAISDDQFLVLISKYFNFKNKTDLDLVLTYLIKLHITNVDSCIILVFQGRQDSGKSSSTEALKFLVDPTDPLLSTPPKTIEDVVLSLNSNYLPAFDNLSGINKELSDFLCSVVYGVKYSKRSLYTDDTLKTYKTKRDLLFNGIEELSNRDDFNDRVLEIELESILPENRKDKTTLNKELESDRPYILYGLYQLISKTLFNLPNIRTENLPRMSDFARIGMAMFASQNKDPNDFLEIYNEKIRDKKSNSFWNDPLCSLILEKLKSKLNNYHLGSSNRKESPELKGTSLELMDLIFKHSGKNNKPKTPRGFSAYLRRCEGLLKSEGIIFTHQRSSERREIIITFEDWKRMQLEQEIKSNKTSNGL